MIKHRHVHREVVGEDLSNVNVHVNHNFDVLSPSKLKRGTPVRIAQKSFKTVLQKGRVCGFYALLMLLALQVFVVTNMYINSNNVHSKIQEKMEMVEWGANEKFYSVIKPMEFTFAESFETGHILREKLEVALEMRDKFDMLSISKTRENEDEVVANIQENNRKECEYLPWQKLHKPTCNVIHELGGDLDSPDTELLSMDGFWRMVWRVKVSNIMKLNTIFSTEFKNSFNIDGSSSKKDKEEVILKMLKFQRMDEIEVETFEQHRRDALAMEILTSSPNIIDVYSYCGNSVVTEVAQGDSSLLLKQKTLKSIDRLNIARDLAKALHDVHRGVGNEDDDAKMFGIIHNDLNPANVVTVSGNKLKLNDFNIAEFLQRNFTSGEACGIRVKIADPLVSDTKSLCEIMFIFFNASKLFT